MPNLNTLPLDRYQDISSTDKNLFNQFISLYDAGDFDGAKAVLDEISLACKGKTSNIFNQIINALNKMENAYIENVQEYLANLLSSLEEIKYIGVYDSATAYNKNNLVAYNDEIYLCLYDITAGILPTVEANWLYLGLKGDDGCGYIETLNYLGDWEGYSTAYVFHVGDMVLEDSTIYYCKVENSNKRPSLNPTYWTVFMYENRQEIEGIDKLPEIYGVKGVGFENSELERTHDSVGLTYEKFPNPDVVTEGVSNSMITPLENTVGGNYIQATNIIENGDFSNGFTRWSASASSLSVSSNTLSVTGNGMTRGAYAYQTTLTPFTAGKKIRFKYMAMVDNDDCVQLEVYIKGSTTGDLTLVKTVSNPDALIWQDIDFITTLPEGHTGNLMVYIGHMYSSPFIADTKVMEVQEFYAVDLTADFGAGNEPDLTECKRIFPTYFEGRQMFDLDKGGVFQSFVEKEYFANQLITNGDFSDGTTGWSTSNLTQSVSNGINTILATSQYGLLYHDLEIDFISGHKYYYCARIQTATATTSIKAGLMDSVNMIGINCASTTEWQTVSQLVTWETGRTLSEFYIQDVRASGWNNIKVDYTMVIDLTATFGIGYEPIFSECQTLFSSYFPEGREIWYTNGGGFQDFQINGLTVTNLITNGNFNGNYTGWTASNIGTPSVADNTCSFTATATNGELLQSNINYITGHTYYVSAWVYSDSSSVALICFNLGTTYKAVAHGGTGWELLSWVGQTVDDAYADIFSIRDSRTSGWTQVKVKDVIKIDLTANNIASYDLATCQSKFPSYFDGTISVDKGEVSVIGKNLFDGIWEGGYFSTVNGTNLANSAYIRTKNYIMISPSTQYVISHEGVGLAPGLDRQYVFYDDNKAFISPVIGTYGQFTTPANARYVKVSTNASISLQYTMQIEKGATITTCAPYNPTRARYPKLQSVPAIQDTFNVLTGLHTQNVQRVNLGDLSWSVSLPETRFRATFSGYKKPLSGTVLASIYCSEYQTLSNDYLYAGNKGIAVHPTADFVFVEDHLSYSDANEFKTAMDGVYLYYELATPVLTQYPAINIPLLEKSTIQYAPYIYDTGTYSTSFSITDTDYPILTLVEVTRNGVPIDISTCTIAGGGLSFTSTVLASGDEIEVRYNHGLPTATPTTEYILNTPSLTTSRIYSDFDSHFPYNEITEVTDSAGNVFVRIPKFYTYRDANSIAISRYKISDLWELNPVFMFGGEERDYVYIGKYEASGSTGRIYSKPSQSVLVNITRTQGRTASLANGSTYFQSDIWVNQLIRDLFTIEFATTNSQAIMYGYAKDNPYPISTGNTDVVYTPSGSPTDNESGNYASKYRNIENVWGNVYKILDGITSYGNIVYVAYDPSLYIDGGNTNYVALKYEVIPRTSYGEYADIMGVDKYNPFAIIPISVGTNPEEGYCDLFYKPDDTANYLLWESGGNWDSDKSAGIWSLIATSTLNSTGTGTRLCAYDII